VLAPASGPAPVRSATALLHLAVHRDRHEPVRLDILELDDLVAAPGKLAPPARLAWVLAQSPRIVAPW